MFTGIITAVGRIARVDASDQSCALRINTGPLDLGQAKTGDSIAVNGACLTATALHDDGFSADVSRETLNLTTLGSIKPGDGVNLEAALTMSQVLGGHMVSGHVDGVGEVISLRDDGTSARLEIRAPSGLERYIARKGSVCVDGVSLTVNAVDGPNFELMIVPHTLGNTIIGSYGAGTRVNVEVDMIARYVERILQYTEPSSGIERTE